MVNGPDIIASMTRAMDTDDTARRLYHLQEAERDCLSILDDIQHAIAEDTARAPGATPVTRRIKLVAEQKGEKA
jgi:hypothetical protein